MCRRALDSGEALERLRAIIERQGGDPRVIDDYSLMPQAPAEHIVGPTAGFVTGLDAELIGRASVVLGAGRDKVDDEIDPAVGIMIPGGRGRRRPGRRCRCCVIQYGGGRRLETGVPVVDRGRPGGRRRAAR